MKRIFFFSLFLVITGAMELFGQSACDSLYIPRGNMYPPERRELCQSDTIVLQGMAPPGDFQMHWFRNGIEISGENLPVLRASQAGNYSFRLSKSGCFSSVYDSVRIGFRNQRRPAARQISLIQSPEMAGDSFTLQIGAFGNPADVSYSWFRNGILQPSTGLLQGSRNPGTYRVLTDSASCFSYSNPLKINPTGAIVPKICAAGPAEPKGLRIEWEPPFNDNIILYKIYRKRFYESAFTSIDSASPASGFWENQALNYDGSFDLFLTAVVNGAGGKYESQPGLVTKTIFAKASRRPEGFRPANLVSWTFYQGMEVNQFYIYRDGVKIDSVPGTRNQYEDFGGSDTAVYLVEAAGVSDCILPLTDQDGNQYNVVQIGGQWWMKENLNTIRYRNGDLIPSELDDNSWQTVNSGACASYNGNPANAETYGRLYNWYAVNDNRGLCPTGWHVPGIEEWSSMFDLLGGNSAAGGKLKEVSSLWANPNTGATNSSGFSGLPGGIRDGFTGLYLNSPVAGNWWTSSKQFPEFDLSWFANLQSNSAAVQLLGNDIHFGNSVRCLRNNISGLNCDSASGTGILIADSLATGVTAVIPYTGGNGGSYPAISVEASLSGVIGLFASIEAGNFANGKGTLTFTISGTPVDSGIAEFNIRIGGQSCTIRKVVIATGSGVSDVDGNSYSSIIIGNQEWMQQNLKVSKYRNNDPITTNLDDATWSNTSNGAYSIYNNLAVNDSIYGKLYNWYAVADPRGLCPAGWHVPDDSEWKTLESWLGMPFADINNGGGRGNSQNIGGKLKSVSNLWANPNSGATNETGFSILPAGIRFATVGYYDFMTITGNFWSSSEQSPTHSWDRAFRNFETGSFRGSDIKTNGFSVRCLRD